MKIRFKKVKNQIIRWIYGHKALLIALIVFTWCLGALFAGSKNLGDENSMVAEGVGSADDRLGTSAEGFSEGSLNEAVSNQTEAQAILSTESPQGDYVEKAILSEGNIMEDKSIYDDDDETSVVTMYLTVTSGNSDDHTDHTWTEVNTYSADYYEENNLDRYNVEGILQIGDENGPIEGEYGYGETVPNVAVQIRGQTTSKLLVKSYKIRIKEGRGSWRGQRTIALNKHEGDPSRFTNKMCYDLMKEIPQMISARTQFVHLYVKDMTQGGSGEYEDYGLFTQVEQMNKTYLKNHGLDSKGQLYKVNDFAWVMYDPLMKTTSDPDYDEKAFEEYIEIKGDDDHTKIQNVMQKINDYTIPIQDVVEEHFDVENIVYWMAFHILTANYDVGTRNLYLYSPLNSEKWYFISWDNDASFQITFNRLRNYSEGSSWQVGMTKYLQVRLIYRMMQEQEYIDALSAAVDDIKNNYLTYEKIDSMSRAYAAVTKPYAFSEPDIEISHATSDWFDQIVDERASEVDISYEYYKESLLKPWPFFVGIPEWVDDGRSLSISWDPSYDRNGEDITYSFLLASDWEFNDVIYKEEDIRIPEVTVDALPAGVYYIRVKALNESGYEQDEFDYTSIHGGYGKAYGCLQIRIDEEGNIYTDDVTIEI